MQKPLVHKSLSPVSVRILSFFSQDHRSNFLPLRDTLGPKTNMSNFNNFSTIRPTKAAVGQGSSKLKTSQSLKPIFLIEIYVKLIILVVVFFEILYQLL